MPKKKHRKKTKRAAPRKVAAHSAELEMLAALRSAATLDGAQE